MSSLFAQEIHINEVVAQNTILHDNYGETDDWLELYNSSSEAINLNGYYLSDKLDDLTKWQVTTDIIITGGGFSFFWLDDDTSQGANHVSFKLSQEGESVFLSKEVAGELTIISTLTTPTLSEDISYGREDNGGSNLLKFRETTPLSSNNNATQLSDDTVFFTLPSGKYPIGTSINLFSTNNTSDLYYTIDGTRPDETSIPYLLPIFLENSLYLRVASYSDNEELSQIFDAFYIVEDLHDLPIVNVAIDPINFTEEDWGIHVRGNNGVSGSCDSFGANWHQDWERDMSFLWLENEECIKEKAKVEIGGGCSRNIVMKTLIIDFEKEEGVDFPFFNDISIQEYHKLKLRASGHDFTQTHLRDGVLHEAMRGKTEIDLMGYRPVVVYVNGEYFGVYNVREVMDKNYITTHYNLEEEMFDMIKRPFHETQVEVKSGDDIAFLELLDFVESNDLNDSIHFQAFEKIVDVENMTDYFIAEMFVANFDWPANNMTMWRERKEDGKWRWMLYDLDASSNFGEWSDSNPYTNSWKHALNPTEAEPEGTTFIAQVLKNEDYRAKFLQRLCSFGQLVLSEGRVSSLTDSLTTILAEEMPQHIDFWSGRPNSWGVGTPVGGSTEAWEDKLDWFKNFFRVRFRVFSDILITRANLAGKFELVLIFDENSGGKVVLHQNETLVPYNYKGEYFKLLPLHVKAVPNSGYEFIHWETTGDKNDELTLINNENIELKPVFRKKEVTDIEEGIGLAVFPNPAFQYLNIEYISNESTKGVLSLINKLGQEMKREEIEISLELQEIKWSVIGFPRGIYFLVLAQGEEMVTKKLVLD